MSVPALRRAAKKPKAATLATPPAAVLLKVRRVLLRMLPQVERPALKPGASLMNELGLDSLKVAELSVALEDAFDRPVFLGEMFAEAGNPAQLTVADLARFMGKRT